MYDDVVARAAAGLHLRASGDEARSRCRPDATNLAWRAAELLADARAVAARRRTSSCTSRSRWPAGWPAVRPTPPATLLACAALWRTGTPRSGTAPARRPARQRRRLPADRRHGAGDGPRRAAHPGAGDRRVPLGARAGRLRHLDRGGVRRARPAARGRHGAGRRSAPPDELLDALRAGDCGRLADALRQRSAGGGAVAAPRAAPTCSPPAPSSARWPASSPARARPARSCARTPTRPRELADAARRRERRAARRTVAHRRRRTVRA